MQFFKRNEDGTKETITLNVSTRKSIATQAKALLKLKRKILTKIEKADPLKAEFDQANEKLKAALLEHGIDECRDNMVVGTIAKPTSTEYFGDMLAGKLTGEELDQYCPRKPAVGVLTKRRDTDEEFAAKIKDCFKTEDGTPTLTIKAV